MLLLDKIQSYVIRLRQGHDQFSSESEADPSLQPSVPTAAEASRLLYASDNSVNDLQQRLELRDIFRDEQLFQQFLPRGKDPRELWQGEGVKTWVDQWSCDTQFVPMDSSRVFFSSALSGLIVSAISTPFDVVKNYWIFSPQFRGTRSAISSREVVRCLYEQNGLKSFYTGFGATCCTLIPSNLIFFGVYEHYKYESPPAIASIKARALAVVCTMPAEYVRTRLQANVGQTTFAEIVRTINVIEGIRSYSKGIIATMLRDAPFSAVYWTLNEKLKAQFATYDTSYADRTTFRAKFLYPFISGASAAAVATTITQPFDVIKTNIQGVDNIFRRRGAYYKACNGVGSIAATIYQSQGFRGFFVGLTPRLAKIMPSCAVLLATYDFSKALLTSDLKDFEIESL